MKTAEQLQAELTAANTQLQAMQATERQRTVDARHAAHVSFCEGLVAAAKWPEGSKDVLVSVMDELATPGETTGVVSFGEGDAAKPLVTVLQEQLQALPVSVSFGEFARNGGDGSTSATAIAAKAVAYQDEQASKGIRVNTAEAVAHVSTT